MSHPFGDLLSQYLHRKHGLSQSKLAAGILQDPAVVGKMCRGQRLTGPHARQRVIAIIHWLSEQDVLATMDEANALLDAAGMATLRGQDSAEANLLESLRPATTHLLRTNLPAPLTSFIGRERELDEVERLIAEHRFVTLTGAGGIGKTRLAIEVGLRLVAGTGPNTLPDGVWLAELRALSDATRVPHAIAGLFRLGGPAGRSHLEVLEDHLAGKHLLLILDNCEHLIDACAVIVEHLLQRCWHLRVLATSREALRVPGEVTYHVPSLQAVDPRPRSSSPPGAVSSQSADVAWLQGCASTRLFLERAYAAGLPPPLRPSEAGAIARICNHLNGMPLALELAAPLTQTIALDDLATQLDRHLSLLVSPHRTATPRHRTMHSALDWSYNLLSAAERQILASLSVFAGGWTADAAQAVCGGAHSDGLPPSSGMPLLAQLVHKSLVVVESRSEQVRYRLLEPIRQYAQEQLTAMGQRDDQRRRHAAHYLVMAEQTDAARDTLEERLWLPRLTVERDNLRAALQWALERGDAEFAQRMNAALYAFWLYGRDPSEANYWLEAALALEGTGPTTPSAAKAKVLSVAGFAAAYQSNSARAMACFEQALALFRALGDRRGVALSLRGCGITALIRNDLAQGQAYFENSLALSHEMEDPGGIAWSLHDLGHLALARGELAQAQLLFQKALSYLREQGILFGVFCTLLALGHVLCDQRLWASAEPYYRKALAIQQEMSYAHRVADGLEGMAGIATAHGHPARAARLYGAAHVDRESTSTPRWVHLQRAYELELAAARAQLSEDCWATAWMEGAAMPLEQAVAYALD